MLSVSRKKHNFSLLSDFCPGRNPDDGAAVLKMAATTKKWHDWNPWMNLSCSLNRAQWFPSKTLLSACTLKKKQVRNTVYLSIQWVSWADGAKSMWAVTLKLQQYIFDSFKSLAPKRVRDPSLADANFPFQFTFSPSFFSYVWHSEFIAPPQFCKCVCLEKDFAVWSLFPQTGSFTPAGVMRWSCQQRFEPDLEQEGEAE